MNTLKVHFTLHYYFPRLAPRPNELLALPHEQGGGLKHGLVNTEQGLKFCLDVIIAEELKAKGKPRKFPVGAPETEEADPLAT